MKNEAIFYNHITNKWLKFQDPLQIFCTYSVDEVIPLLESIDERIRDNFYLAGFISYEASPAFDPALKTKDLSSFPLCWFGVFDKARIVQPAEFESRKYEVGQWIPSVNRSEYFENIKKVKEYIAAGYTYQVNYTYRLRSSFKGDPLSFFWDLVDKQKSDYVAYVNIGDFAVCSVSPELFFKLDGSSILSKPMKGTATRGKNSKEDIEIAQQLHLSEKDRAENTMIVDMIRNDLGKISNAGNVQVDSLYDIEKYQTVLQMTSSIKAKTDTSLSGIFSAMFPGASITGAPKYQTTKIILELEKDPRKIYTGCIGFVQPGRKAQFNIAIRTVLIDRKLSEAEYGVGSGIIWDSDEKKEYEECQTKTRILMDNSAAFDLLETILWTPEDGFFLLDYHIRRLEHSAGYFNYSINTKEIRGNLEKISYQFSDNRYKIRVLLAPDGTIKITSDTFQSDKPEQPVRLAISNLRVKSSDPMLYHKTTNRQLYDRAVKFIDKGDDVILINEHKEITETTICNIVVKKNGQFITPHIDCGLLPGTFRAWLLDNQEIAEGVIKMNDLKTCDNIFVINSLRKWQKAILI